MEKTHSCSWKRVLLEWWGKESLQMLFEFQQQEGSYTAKLLFMHHYLKYTLKLLGGHVYVLGKSEDFTWAWMPPFLRALNAVFLLWSLPSSFSPVQERNWLNESSGFCLEKKKLRVTFRVTFFIFWGDDKIQLHHSII